MSSNYILRNALLENSIRFEKDYSIEFCQVDIKFNFHSIFLFRWRTIHRLSNCIKSYFQHNMLIDFIYIVFYTFSCLFCALYTLWRVYLNICSTIHFSKYIQWHVRCSRVPFECKWRGKVCHYTYFEKLWVKYEGISISKGKFNAWHYKHCGGIAILSCYTYSNVSKSKGLLRNLSLTNITQWLHAIDLLFFKIKRCIATLNYY